MPATTTKATMIEPAPADFRILFVCTANLCRSPMAESLLRYGLDQQRPDGQQWAISSAGVYARGAQPMHPHTAEVLAERGIATENFRSRRISPALLADSDLVLTMTRRQRSETVLILPSVVRRIYTLRQFARLVDAGRSAVATGLVAGTSLLQAAQAGRQHDNRSGAGDLAEDVSDPIGGPVEDFRLCANSIWDALGQAFLSN